MPHSGMKCLALFELFFQGFAKPGPGVLPVPIGDRSREPQGHARFFDGEPAEEVEVSDLGRHGIFGLESIEQVVEGKHKIEVLGDRGNLIEEFEPDSAAGSLEPIAIAGVVDQDPPHGLGSGGEEVSAAVELLVADQPQVRLVDECGGVEGVIGGFGGHAGGGEPPQLVVHEREQVSGGTTITGRGCFEKVGYSRHFNKGYQLFVARSSGLFTQSTNHHKPCP